MLVTFNFYSIEQHKCDPIKFKMKYTHSDDEYEGKKSYGIKL